MVKSISDMKRRTVKTIIHQLEKLIRKYRYDDVRMVINRYFQDVKEKERIQFVIADQEAKLIKLKGHPLLT